MLKIYPGIERWRTERCPHICPLLQPSAYTFIIYIYICIEAETEIIATRNCYARLWPRIASSYWTITAEASPNTQLVFILYFCINAPQLVSLPLHLSRSQPFVFSSLSPTRSKKKKKRKNKTIAPGCQPQRLRCSWHRAEGIAQLHSHQGENNSSGSFSLSAADEPVRRERDRDEWRTSESDIKKRRVKSRRLRL